MKRHSDKKRKRIVVVISELKPAPIIILHIHITYCACNLICERNNTPLCILKCRQSFFFFYIYLRDTYITIT